MNKKFNYLLVFMFFSVSCSEHKKPVLPLCGCEIGGSWERHECGRRCPKDSTNKHAKHIPQDATYVA